MRSDFCNQVFSFSENDLEDDDKLDCTGGYDNDDDDIYIMMKCPYVYCMYVFASFLMECKEFILSDWSPPDDPARPCQPFGYGLVTGWQKLRERASGARRKVWTRTKKFKP